MAEAEIYETDDGQADMDSIDVEDNPIEVILPNFGKANIFNKNLLLQEQNFAHYSSINETIDQFIGKHVKPVVYDENFGTMIRVWFGKNQELIRFS